MNCDLPVYLGERYKAYMKETIGNLIKKRREAQGWTQTELGKRVSAGQSIISDIERDEKPVSSQMAIKLHQVLGIPIDVLTGKISVATWSQGCIHTAPVSHLPVSVVIRASSLKTLIDLPERRTELVEVPIVNGSIAAGTGRILDDVVEDWAWLPISQLHGHSRENLVCVKITGESMEPVIHTGAIVCVDRADRPVGKKLHDRSIYAVRTGQETVSVKYIRVTDHIMALLSANLDQPPIMLDLRSQASPVIGRVVWMWQTM